MRTGRHCDSGGRLSRRYGKCPAGVRHNREFSGGALQAGEKWTAVVVWVTISMADRRAAQGWYTENGDYVDWSTNDHGAVLIGYTDTTVTIADPISGRMEYSREQFEKVFSSRGNRCVVLE